MKTNDTSNSPPLVKGVFPSIFTRKKKKKINTVIINYVKTAVSYAMMSSRKLVYSYELFNVAENDIYMVNNTNSSLPKATGEHL
jgi:hypothetical protein